MKVTHLNLTNVRAIEAAKWRCTRQPGERQGAGEIMKIYPSICRDAIRATLCYAADLAKEFDE